MVAGSSLAVAVGAAAVVAAGQESSLVAVVAGSSLAVAVGAVDGVAVAADIPLAVGAVAEVGEDKAVDRVALADLGLGEVAAAFLSRSGKKEEKGKERRKKRRKKEDRKVETEGRKKGKK